jgi:hypothetical protein
LEPPPQFRDQFLVLEKNAHFRVQGHRPRIEIEGADEAGLVVNAERLGVQTGAFGAKYRDRRLPAEGLKLEQLDATPQQTFAVIRIGPMHRSDIRGCQGIG